MIQFIRKLSVDTKSIPLGVKLVILVIFMRTLGWGFVDPFFSIFVEQFSRSYTQIGFLVAIMNSSTLIMLIPLIRLADKVKDTTLMRDGQLMYFFAILFYILAGVSGQLIFLILGFIFNGLGLPLVHVGAETYIRKNSGFLRATETFSFYTTFHHLGWVLGMVIGAFTIQFYGFNWMFLFILPSVVLGVLILRRIRENGLKSIIMGFFQYFHKKQDFQDLMSEMKALDHRVFFFLLLSFFDGIMVMFILLFVPLFALTLELSLKEISLLMAITYLPFAFSFLITEATNGLKKMHVISFGFLICALAFALMSFNLKYSWLIAMSATISLCISIIRPAYNGMLTRLTPSERAGQVTGLNNIMMRLGCVLGPIFTGFLADRLSLTHVFFSMAIFALLLAASSLLFRSLETAIAPV